MTLFNWAEVKAGRVNGLFVVFNQLLLSTQPSAHRGRRRLNGRDDLVCVCLCVCLSFHISRRFQNVFLGGCDDSETGSTCTLPSCFIWERNHVSLCFYTGVSMAYMCPETCYIQVTSVLVLLRSLYVSDTDRLFTMLLMERNSEWRRRGY